MTDLYTLCPYCGDTLSPHESVCPACQENLAGLIKLEKQHLMLYNEAIDAARAGALDDAVLALKMSLRLQESFAPAARLLAKVYARQGRWCDARRAAMRAQTLLPEDRELADFLIEIDRAEAGQQPQPQEDVHLYTRERQAAQSLAAEAEQRDIVAAFGAGATAVGLFAFIVGLLRGGRD